MLIPPHSTIAFWMDEYLNHIKNPLEKLSCSTYPVYSPFLRHLDVTKTKEISQIYEYPQYYAILNVMRNPLTSL